MTRTTEAEVASQSIAVVIADDDPEICRALSELVEDHPDMTVSGIAHTGWGAVELVDGRKVDLVVIDVMMPGGGVTAIGQIREVAPTLPIAVYTATRARRAHADLLKAGATAVFSKGDQVDLADALSALAARR